MSTEQSQKTTESIRTPEMRVFISSTFNDLQPEREQLVKKVFPKFRALCRARGVEFTEIDLRWGITTEEARTGKVVRICLEEIDKCRPYFIGIMGSRYGWRPTVSDVEKDLDLMDLYPWVRDFAKKNRSITELEFTYGALHSENTDSAFIYEQDCEDRISEEDRRPFADLKMLLRNTGLLSHKFATPEELGDHVLRDLVSLLDRDFPSKREPTALELERLPHVAFSINRRRSYVADPLYYERFSESIASDTQPLVIHAKSGLGKSALMAYMMDRYVKEVANTPLPPFIITYFIGSAATGSDADDVIRHIMMEIKDKYKLDDEIPTDEAKMKEELPLWFAKMGSEILVLAIDALNQLSGVDAELHWLPEFIPPNVRLVVSITPGIGLDNLRKRNWTELELRPLEIGMRRRIAKEYLTQFHKTLTREQEDHIATDPKCESPLFLRTLLEELRVFGRFEEFESHLANYLASIDERDLFHKILVRMEADHGEELLRSIMLAIWASREGLSENELLSITHASRVDLSTMLIAHEYHLMQRSGLFAFFHNYLRDAVEIRYASDEQLKRLGHRQLAIYFSNEEYTTRRRDEEPWQWKLAEEPERFKECISDIPMLEMLLDESRRQELIGYWVELQKHFDLAETFHSVMTHYRLICKDPSYFAELSGKLGEALVSASIYKEAEIHLLAALEIKRSLFGEDDLAVAKSMNDLSFLYYHSGDFEKAVLLLRKVIAIREKLLDGNDPAVAKAWNDLGVLIYSQGKLDEAIECYEKSLKKYESFFKKNHPEVASTLSNIGTIYYFKKMYPEASLYFERSITMYEHLYGSNNFNIIPPLSNLAMVYTQSQEYDRAEPLILKTLSLSKAIYGNIHDSIRIIYVNLGFFYSKIGDYREAIVSHQDALEISKRLVGEDHYLTINSYLSVGMNLYRAGDLVTGKMLIEKYLPIQEATLGSNHRCLRYSRTAGMSCKKNPSQKLRGVKT